MRRNRINRIENTQTHTRGARTASTCGLSGGVLRTGTPPAGVLRAGILSIGALAVLSWTLPVTAAQTSAGSQDTTDAAGTAEIQIEETYAAETVLSPDADTSDAGASDTGTSDAASQAAADSLSSLTEAEIYEKAGILYSNRRTALYEAPYIDAAVVVAAKDFPNNVPVEVTGITTTGFYQVEVGGTYYIPGTGLEEYTDPDDAALSLDYGLQELNGELVFVQEDGTLLKDGWYNYLYFDESGYYTTGNEELDALVDAALDACIEDTMSDEEKLRAAYVYIRDHYTYLSRAHHERGTTDWTEESAVFMLTNQKGNCYCYAAAFLYMARRLGYDTAYAVSGGVGTNNADHAWVMITMEDGAEYMFDVELEYAYLYRYANRHAYDLYRMTTATAPFIYYFP